MHWATACIAVGLVIVFYWLKRRGQISPKDARRQLDDGALLIDVRTLAEFNSGHLPTAIHYPLDQIEMRLPQRVADKNQSMLLHCQSGMRSGIAVKKLKSLGYGNAFNLGSYSRAARIAGQR